MALALLDTSYCIEIIRGNPLPEQWRKHRFCVSTVIEAELWAGVYHSGGPREQSKVQKLLAAVECLPFDSAAAEQSGKVLGSLAKAGQSIGDFDAQIAGHALSINAFLATKNRKHFQRIKGLKLLDD
jgi:tRNA(fMet)-specific endonuclease VapC